MKHHLSLALASGLLTMAAATAATAAPLKVGVTLHPYYSWTKNVVKGTDVEVIAVLPGDVDAGNYQPRPADIKKLASLDALVINDLGHDAFIFGMLKAAGNHDTIHLIRTNKDTPVIRNASGKDLNSHTFISFTNAVQQTYTIQRALSKLAPQHAKAFRKNAMSYARRLRRIKAKAAGRLADAHITKAVTVHDGYSYLLQEFGLELSGVVEPSHGLVPSAGELAQTIKLLKAESTKIVLSEESFPKPLLDTLTKQTGAQVYVISHIASGPYTDDKFEKEMAENAEILVRAMATKK